MTQPADPVPLSAPPTESPAAAGETGAERLERALSLHQGGRLVAAERLYRALLEEQPEHPEALHLLGVLCGQRGDPIAGLDLIGRALAARPRRADYLANLGHLCWAAGRHEAALTAWQDALAVRPDQALVWRALGSGLASLGRLEPAAAALARATALLPGHAETLVELGAVEARRGQTAEAEAAWRRALEIAPGHVDAGMRLGLLRAAAGDPAGAAAAFEAVTAAAPGHVEAWFQLGTARLALRQFRRAEPALRAALARRPDHAEALVNLGNLRRRLGDHAEALALYRQAVAGDAAPPEAGLNLASLLREQGYYTQAVEVARTAVERLTGTAGADRHIRRQARYNLANALRDADRLDEAIALYRAVLAEAPNSVEAEWNLSLALLLAGQYQSGWRHHESRWRRPEMTRPQFPCPTWDGRALPQGRLLVWTEQGFGDTIQFLRLVPAIAARVGTVALVVPPVLKRLAAHNVPDNVRVTDSEAPVPVADCEISLISAARVIGMTRENPTPGGSYLAASADRVNAWRQRLALDSGGRRTAGLVWAGNPHNTQDHQRSLPAGELETLLEPLLARPEVAWFSLQVGPRAAECSRLVSVHIPPWRPAPNEGGCKRLPRLGGASGVVIDLAPELTDFAETAAALTALDLLVGVETAVTHLAGALGRPGLVMLPVVPDWRWRLTGQDRAWYPTLRLVRQPAPGAWAAVIAAVAEALPAFLAPDPKPE